jgi:hypothetical protein
LSEGEYEVWADDSVAPPHLLTVVPDLGGRFFRILDPQKGNEEVFSVDSYLEIVDYLSEEDYVRVKGRMVVERLDDEDP